MPSKTQKIAARTIGIGFFAYAFMLTQANPAQGSLSYLVSLWGIWGVWFFIAWFVTTGILLFFVRHLVDIYWCILPQIGYFVIASAYVLFHGILRNGGAQWGSLTTHGFGTMMLILILWLLAKIEMQVGNGTK